METPGRFGKSNSYFVQKLKLTLLKPIQEQTHSKYAPFYFRQTNDQQRTTKATNRQQGFCEIGAELLNLNIGNSIELLCFIEHLCLECPNFAKPKTVSGNLKAALIIEKKNLFMQKKALVSCSLFLISLTSFSQDSKDVIVKRIKTFIKQYSVTPGTNKTGKNSIVYYNKVDKILDIDGFQIPLLEVKTSYYYSKQQSNHCVSFDCRNENDCVMDPQGYGNTGFAAPFINKQKCYEFIELISQLKK